MDVYGAGEVLLRHVAGKDLLECILLQAVFGNGEVYRLRVVGGNVAVFIIFGESEWLTRKK